MRPQILNPFFAGATSLKGIGDKVEKTLAKLVRPGIDETTANVRLIDILLHLPAGVIDRRERPNINDLPMEGIVTVEVTIGRHKPPPRNNKRVPYRVDCFDDTGNLSLVFFHVHGDYLQRILPVGETRFVSGSIEYYSGQPQMVHPDHMLTGDEFAKMPLLEPVYPLTAGLSGKVLSRAIRQVLEEIPALDEWQDSAWVSKQKWLTFNEALRAVHIPEESDVLDPQSPVRQRLAFDELLANQLALGLVRRHMKAASGRSIRGSGTLQQKVVVFVARELDSGEIGMKPGTAMYSAFMPTTPNPTSGFLFFLEKQEVTILDLTVEEGAKLVISAGLVTPAQAHEQVMAEKEALKGNIDAETAKRLKRDNAAKD